MCATEPFDPSHIPTTTLEQWREGLTGEDQEKQWKTFEQMYGFTDFGVMKVIEQFLAHEAGDPWLKTKVLQKMRHICPWSISFPIYKFGQKKTMDIQEVPLTWEEWSEEERLIWTLFEKHMQDQDPTLVHMGQELWQFYLEKHFPFLPAFTACYSWTAGLHYYTVKVVQPDHSEEELPQVAALYGVSTDDVLDYDERLRSSLLK